MSELFIFLPIYNLGRRYGIRFANQFILRQYYNLFDKLTI
jgi:hypothetical protein